MSSKYAVMCLSGGMDSTGLLMQLVSDGYTVKAISFRYGQKHVLEIERAKANLAYLADHGHTVDHQIVDLVSVMSLFNSALTQESIAMPEGFYEQENMIATVVPNRNAIFASLAFGVALSLSIEKKQQVILALGVHSGDHAIYPDCRPEFYEKLAAAFSAGNWKADQVVWDLPYLYGDKASILRDTLSSCEKLGLRFDTVLANTNTSYNPDDEGRSSGKSGADVERILAFHEIGRADPVAYVDPWEVVLANALKAKEDFAAAQK